MKKKQYKCPNCGPEMIEEYLDGPGGSYYKALVCIKCGYESNTAPAVVIDEDDFNYSC